MPQQIDFPKAFFALTGHKPFPWQERLYDKFLAGADKIPPVCDIPTGLGKTNVIAIWLIALAARGEAGHLPRRLVYVVNRRTIVDQSTDVVKQIRQRLSEPENKAWKEHCKILRVLRDGLERLAGTDGLPLAVSTLRGELADNEEWKHDPRCPAIVVGTIDMIGSKLLFSGYGDSRYFRPLHAGLLGCDTLFVHDEAHLAPAFGKLLRSVEEQFGGEEDFGLPSMMRVIELSATHRDSSHESNGKPFTINKDDREYGEIKKRFCAKKSLQLHEVEKTGKEVSDKIAQLALEHDKSDTPQRVVVFVRSPKDAEKIVSAIEKGLGASKSYRVSILTGEIRGYERDALLNRQGMKPFVGGEENNKETVYLVATSAGEVGMDLHADHAVCDLSTLDSLIQRLGRVNRFGQTKARIDLVHEKLPKEDARAKTLKILQNKRAEDDCADVCPNALLQWLEEEDSAKAFSVRPETVELTDILTDLWAQTSLNDIPACPKIAPWLHGIQDNLPETWVAWRKEVPLLCDSKTIDNKDVAQWFKAARIGSREKLRMPTYRFLDLLHKKRKPTPWVQKHAKTSVVVLSTTGEAQRVRLDELAEQKLDFATVVFPTELDALNESGFFDHKGGNKEPDVADDKHQRIMLKHKGNKFCFTPLGEDNTCCEKPEEDDGTQNHCLDWESLSAAIKAVVESFPAEQKEQKTKLKLRMQIKEAEEYQDDDDIEENWLLLLQAVSDPRDDVDADSPTVAEHNDDVAKLVGEMAVSFDLPASLQKALQLAGQHHDTGKANSRWQIAAGHDPHEDGFQPKAKPISGGVDWRMLDGYRHDLGSVVAACDIDEINQHPERDLILHLIATHHGWARPHFKEGAFPPDTNEKLRARIHGEVMHNYIRLQEHFGHWRLAWLETLLRRADGIVSASYNETSTEEEES